MKKLACSLVLATSVFAGLVNVSPVNAAGTSPMDLNTQLKNIGVPGDLIADMSDSEKNDILSEDGIVFNSATTTIYNNLDDDTSTLAGKITYLAKQGPIFEPGPDPIPGGVSTQATISKGRFDYTVKSFDIKSKDGRTRQRAYVSYHWKNAPAWGLTDSFGVAWSTKWRAIDGTSVNHDEHKLTSSSDWVTDDHTTAVAYASGDGIGWHADLNNFLIHNISEAKGYGRVNIETKATNNPSGSDQLFANYAHIKGTFGSIGLGFGPLSVTYEGSASADTRGDWTTFKYQPK
ncbi:hypothetical protein LCY76_16540 [Fictibacillus sp. KIGAM418]|uniref:Uncharacterized protein n=1 Tax=Fictibacillus marinisediminis TaxID=2878389 RepID=A0A9X1XCJ0_9BACL|nr:hypothetical protein [Fictibacillus marinisediminis]MCK6258184.1 hypothetical protein [Fictibacillus marinisediminis]